MVTVQTGSAIRDLMLIQQNKFYWVSNRSGVAELVRNVTPLTKLPFPKKRKTDRQS